MVLTGNSFGTGSPLPSVSLGGVSCTVTFANHTMIMFKAPVGVGINRQVLVTVAGQVSTNNLPFSYVPPFISSISPLTAPTQGGAQLAITGTSLGVSDIVVTVGGQPCAVQVATSHTQITCTLPAGQGANLPVIVTTGSQASNTNVFFSYSPPTINTVSPLNGPSVGGTVLLFSLSVSSI